MAPDGLTLLARRVQTGRRVKLPRPMVRGWYEPCTFEQWMLFEEHFLHMSGTMRRRPRDSRSGLPSTTLGHVSATERWPTSPLWPWVSVDTIHCQNTTGCHLSTGVGERVLTNGCVELLWTFLVDPARFGHGSRRVMFRTTNENPQV